LPALLLDAFDAPLQPVQKGLEPQLRQLEEHDLGQRIAVPLRLRLGVRHLGEPLETGAPLGGDNLRRVEMAEPPRQADLQERLVPKVEADRRRSVQPALELFPALVGQVIDLLVRPLRLGDPRVAYEPVALQPVERRVDLADVELTVRDEVVLVGRAQLVAVERPLR